MHSELLSQGGLSLERLGTFCRVARAGGMTRAAGGDAVRQSQYSRQVKELEAFFGAELLKRHGRTVSLTEAGQRLARLAEAQLSALGDFRRECRNQTVPVSIGGGESLFRWNLIPNWKRLVEEVPGVDFRLLNLRSADVVRRLRDGELDLGLVRQDAVHAPLRKSPFARVGFALYAPKRMVSGAANDWKMLLGRPLVGLEGDGEFQGRLAGWAETQGVRLAFRLVLPSFPLVAEALRATQLSGVLPEAASSEMADAGFARVKPPGFRALERQISVAWSPGTEAVRPVLSRCAEALGKLLG
jgi:DNA-binding transcriptional LysR family regulator